MGKQPLVFILLLLFASTAFCFDNEQYRLTKKFQLSASEDGKIRESVEIAVKFTTAMEDIIEILPQNDLSITSKKILKSSGIIGNFICLGLGIPEDNDMTEKLDEMTEKLVEKFEEIGAKIDKGIKELKAFIEANKFEELIIIPVKQLIKHMNEFYTSRTPELSDSLNQTCKKYTPQSIFYNIENLLDGNSISNQMIYEEYSEAAFERIETVYKDMMKELLIVYPVCETLINGELTDDNKIEKRNAHIVKSVAQIEEKLKKENEKRIKAFKQINEAIRKSREAYENLKSRVAEYKMRPRKGYEVETIYGTAECGEHFAILVTQTAWVYVKLFTQEISEICGRSYVKSQNENWLVRRYYWTPGGAKEVAYKWKDLLEKGKYERVLQWPS